MRRALALILVAFILLGGMMQLASNPVLETTNESGYNLQRASHQFIQNLGQCDDDILFYSMSGDIAFNREKIILANGGVELTFPGSNHVIPAGIDRAGHSVNYFRGAEESWITGIGSFGQVIYEDLWDNIDLVYYHSQEGLKYDLVLNPGACPGDIEVMVQGQESMYLDDGGLVIACENGRTLRDTGLVAMYTDGQELDAAFKIDDDSYTFRLEDFDSSRTAIIDPVVYSTYLGGEEDDFSTAIAVDSLGCAYITGSSRSPDFPVTEGALDQEPSNTDAFVIKMNSTGESIDYCTFIGGGEWEQGSSIEVDNMGCAYVAGVTYSQDFPVTLQGYDRDYAGTGDGFVLKLGPGGDNLEYSTFLGGSHDEIVTAIKLDQLGNAYLTGRTWSGDFPFTKGAMNTSINGDSDVFVTALSSSGDYLVFSTFLGGTGSEQANDLALDSQGNVWIAGQTSSLDFPLVNGLQNISGSVQEAFAACLEGTGESLECAFTFGGSDLDYAAGIEIGDDGIVYVAGNTQSQDFPVSSDALDRELDGPQDAFVMEMDGDGGIHFTYLGGSGDDRAMGIQVDKQGFVFVSGQTSSWDFPVSARSDDRTIGGEADGFIARLGPGCGELHYSGFIGGEGMDLCTGLALGPKEHAFLTGLTNSTDFPVTALDFRHNGRQDCFVIKTDISAPVAIAGPDMVINESHDIHFNGSQSYDNAGIESYTWTLYNETDTVTLYGPEPVYALAVPGNYSVLLNVTDSAGNWNITTLNLDIMEYPIPVANAGDDITASQGEQVIFNGSRSRDNVGIVEYIWSFDDGLNSASAGGPEPLWTFNVPGKYTISLTVFDIEGNSDVDFMNVTVLDAIPPKITGAPISEAGLGSNFSFPSLEIDDTSPIVNYSWRFQYGNETVTLWGQEPVFAFQEPGDYLVNITARDSSGNEGTQSMVVSVPEKEAGGKSDWMPILVIVLIFILAALILIELFRIARPPEGGGAK